MKKRNELNKAPKQRSSNTNVRPSAANGKPISKKGKPLMRKKTAKPQPQNAQRANAAARTVPEKTSLVKSRPQKRKKFRGGNYILYYVLGLIVAAIVFIVLANTVLFKCTTIEVAGSVMYSAEEIVEVSGLQLGENLLHVNISSARDNIVNALAYIDDAQVKKSFPTKISIVVTEAEKQYCIVEKGITAAISHNGKILEYCESGDLPVVKGFEPESTEVGKWLVSKSEGKTEIPGAIFEMADKTGLDGITEVDVTDKFSVKVTVDDRVILNLGPAEEIERKFRVAVEIIDNQLAKDEYVTLLLTNPEKVPVQNNSVPQQSKPVSSSSAVSSSTSSQPTPEPAPDPEVDPDPDPDPEPDYDPEPEPDYGPEPEPDYDPEPEE